MSADHHKISPQNHPTMQISTMAIACSLKKASGDGFICRWR
jgi:hypothetical protein